MKKVLKSMLAIMLVVAMTFAATPLAEIVGIDLFTTKAEATTYESGYYVYSIENNNAIIKVVSGEISGDVTIPSTLGGYPVTKIDFTAFEFCNGITSLTIPNTVKTIGVGAFLYCQRLQMVSIPDSVTGIGNEAFEFCSSLKEVTVPGSVTYLGKHAFSGCKALVSAKLSDGIPAINEGTFSSCASLTNVSIPYSVKSIGKSAFSGCEKLKDIYYSGTRAQWNAITVADNNQPLINATIHCSDEEQDNIYNLGEETYSFKNFSGSDANGHCFGMSVTSSGYYMKALNVSAIGINSSRDLYKLSLTEDLENVICYFHKFQGDEREKATIAGGTWYKTYKETYGKKVKSDIERDWNEVIGFVKNHDFDGSGLLQIGFRGSKYNKEGKLVNGGHAVNFLRYEEVNGQQRIYIYDNNYPDIETYLYKGEDGKIKQSPKATFEVSIDCIALRSVPHLLAAIDDDNLSRYVYAEKDSISISEATLYPMEDDDEMGERILFEIPEGVEQITITPLVDNAEFEYLDENYSFGDIDNDTVGVLTLALSDNTSAEFEVGSAGESESLWDAIAYFFKALFDLIFLPITIWFV